MNRKTAVKLTLDLIMVLLLLLMYRKNVVSLDFHEIGGLALFGLFLIHNLLNWKWIAKVSPRLFDRRIPVKTKIGYWLNTLLLLCFVLIILSGVMISEVLFRFSASPDWKTVHYFAAALALILIGAHVGLHWKYLSALWRKTVRLPKAAARPLGALLLVLLLGFGGYSLSTTSFLSWIAEPFDSGVVVKRDIAVTRLVTETGNTIISPAEGNGHGGGQGRGRESASDASDIALLMAQYLSITSLFAAATVLTERLVTRGKRRAALPLRVQQ